MASPWEIVEASPEAAAALTWKRWLGPAFDAAAAVCLRETRRTVERIPCGRHCACNHRVRPHGGTLTGLCDCGEECEPMTLTEADVKVWEVDLGRLARAVARALNCTAVAKPFGPPCTVQVAALGNPVMPVLLTIQPNAERYRDVIAHLAAKLPKGFILLTPRPIEDAQSLELLTKGNAGAYDLESHFTLQTGSKLHSSKNARTLFAAHLPESREAMNESEAKRIFVILQKLRSKRAGGKAPLYDVFMATVMDGLSQRAAAKKCECSPAQMSKRVGELEREFGLPLKQLQNYIKPILEMQTAVKGEQRRKRKPGSGPGAFADDNPSEDNDDSPPPEEYRDEESVSDD
jgi:hypothetical protein